MEECRGRSDDTGVICYTKTTMHNYLRAWKKFAVCSGRATRAEYWQFFLVNMLIVFVLYVYVMVVVSIVKEAITGIWFPFWLYLLVLYSLAVIVPHFSVIVRRLHDTNRSGWWTLVNFVPFAGLFILLYFLAQDSQPGENRYGPNPKETAA